MDSNTMLQHAVMPYSEQVGYNAVAAVRNWRRSSIYGSLGLNILSYCKIWTMLATSEGMRVCVPTQSRNHQYQIYCT